MTVTSCFVIYGQRVTCEQAMELLKKLFGDDKIREALEKENYDPEDFVKAGYGWPYKVMFDELLENEHGLDFVEYPHDQGENAVGVFGVSIGYIDFGESKQLPCIKKIDTKEIDEKLIKLNCTQDNAYHVIPNDCNCCS